ncbi:hypothetical protein KIH74_21335 [Kineosporia sp. J2-2]|uniref:Uncharacterized protein n=1 Tax=Kineosporia corallincola TaxID=2835133 RepID=A0ABS5TK67_9ACTN|nr:hypothetical protein [Kineosporia corallincola]MBT0771495.1 hypothetical protein [Kineosporia corallincola]
MTRPTGTERFRDLMYRFWRWITFRSGQPPADGGPPAVTANEVTAEDRRIFIHPDPVVLSWETPARGDAFPLVVQARITWTAQRVREDDEKQDQVTKALQDAVSGVRESLEAGLHQEVRDIVREFPPWRAAQAEQALARELASTVCHSDGDIECHRTFFVSLAEPVRQRLEASTFQNLDLEMRGELSVAGATVMTQAREAWHSFLREGVDQLGRPEHGERPTFTGWMAPWATHLAENPGQVGKILREMYDERERKVETLFTEVHRMTAGQSDVGVLNFTLKHDSALRALFDTMMVQVPPPAPGSPFAQDNS